LVDDPELIPLFDRVREIPHIIDGIRCHCGCAHHEGYYSLLTCFEAPYPMAVSCPGCRRQAESVTGLRLKGKSLEEIRARVDEQFRR
jgi:hypothetical protein